MNPFPMIEKAVKELLETQYPDAEGKVGGDMSYNGTDDFYVWIGLIPGGSTDQIEGDWIVDIDVFAASYAEAMERALALEPVLIGPRKVTSVLRFDNVYQNEGPAERPWDDESVFRIGATYALTARRPTSSA